MSYEIPEKWSIEQLRTYVIERGAGLEALASLPAEELQHLPPAERDEELRRAGEWKKLTPRWTEFEGVLNAELAAIAKEEREALVRRGRVRAADVRFDGAATALGAIVQLASGNNPKNAPYCDLFGTTTLTEGRRMGATNAAKWARPLAAKAMALDDSFGPAARRLDVFANVLEHVGDDRDGLEVARALAQARRIKLHSALEDLVADTERAILEFLPRIEAKDVVRQLLSPIEDRPGKPRQVAPEPA